MERGRGSGETASFLLEFFFIDEIGLIGGWKYEDRLRRRKENKAAVELETEERTQTGEGEYG